jgi:hypothetical protein
MTTTMRSILQKSVAALALVFALNAVAELPASFPLPKDAGKSEAAPGGGGKIQVFEVPRGKDAVLAELRRGLATGGWELVSDETSPRGAVRLQIKRENTTLKVSLTGDATRTALIVTLP